MRTLPKDSVQNGSNSDRPCCKESMLNLSLPKGRPQQEHHSASECEPHHETIHKMPRTASQQHLFGCYQATSTATPCGYHRGKFRMPTPPVLVLCPRKMSLRQHQVVAQQETYW